EQIAPLPADLGAACQPQRHDRPDLRRLAGIAQGTVQSEGASLAPRYLNVRPDRSAEALDEAFEVVIGLALEIDDRPRKDLGNSPRGLEPQAVGRSRQPRDLERLVLGAVTAAG